MITPWDAEEELDGWLDVELDSEPTPELNEDDSLEKPRELLDKFSELATLDKCATLDKLAALDEIAVFEEIADDKADDADALSSPSDEPPQAVSKMTNAADTKNLIM